MAIFEGGCAIHRLSELSELIVRLFPERQILYRVNGEVRFYPVSMRKQMQICCAMFVILAGVGYAATSLIYLNIALDQRNDTIARYDVDYNKIKQRAKETGERQVRLAGLLNRHRLLLAELSDQRSHLQARLFGTEEKLHSAEQSARGMNVDKNKLNDQIVELEQKVRNIGQSRTVAENSVLETERALDNSAGRIASLIAERDKVLATSRRLKRDVDILHKSIRNVESRQQKMVAHIQKKTTDTIHRLEKAVKFTGLDVDLLIARYVKRNAGVGGPFVKAPELDEMALAATDGDILRADLSGLDNKLKQWLTLNRLVIQLPLVKPVGPYKRTSRFGRRRDPFNKSWASHSGLDFGAPFKAQVYATGPGKVVLAERKGPYGRTIDIDHGLGIVTRYSHLYRIDVKIGDKVFARQPIGLVGSSGRSTGAHLHYEVQYDGKPVNPEKFLKAGRYVFKE